MFDVRTFEKMVDMFGEEYILTTQEYVQDKVVCNELGAEGENIVLDLVNPSRNLYMDFKNNERYVEIVKEASGDSFYLWRPTGVFVANSVIDEDFTTLTEYGTLVETTFN